MPKLSIKTETLRQALRVAATAQVDLPAEQRRVSLQGREDKDGNWFSMLVACPEGMHLELCGAAEGKMEQPLCLLTGDLNKVVQVCSRSEAEQPVTLARAGDNGPVTVTVQGQAETLKAAADAVATWLPESAEGKTLAEYQPAQLLADLAFVRAAANGKGPRAIAFAGKHMVSTNGYSLHVCLNRPAMGDDHHPALLPARAGRVLEALLSLPGAEVANCSEQPGPAALVFQTNSERLGSTLAAKVEDATFPQYRAVMPKKGAALATATVMAEPLRAALKRATTDGKGVRLTLGKMLRLEAVDLNDDSAATAELAVLECDRKGDDKATVVQCFDANLLLRATGEGNAVVLAFCHPNDEGAFVGPLVVRKDHRLALVMPVKPEAKSEQPADTKANQEPAEPKKTEAKKTEPKKLPAPRAPRAA